MYLLIQVESGNTMNYSEFTFHNVSINSLKAFHLNILFVHLHSIMYLLIRGHRFLHFHQPLLFTFHNVSINSDNLGNNLPLLQDLHSIMYLLIQSIPRDNM